MPKRDILPNLLPPAFIFVFTLTIYIITLSRSVYFGDSGEFIAVAKTLGIAHPPGYPLYTLIAHLFTYLPFGNLAFKVNLFSALTSSATAVVVYLICFKLTKNRLASVSAALFLAFSYLFWLYSLVAEVFSLNNLFIALLILISLYIFENPKNTRLYYLLSFTLGLSLTNHHTMLFLAPALLFLVLSTNPKFLLQPKFIILNTSFLILGLLPYLYLPLRALQNPVLNWGDPDTLEKFLNVILRKDFGTFSLSPSVGRQASSLEPLLFYFSTFAYQFLIIGIIFGIVGLVELFKVNKKLLIFTLIPYLLGGPLFFFLTKTIPDTVFIIGALERFMLFSIVAFVPWFGIGLSKTIQYSYKFLGLPAKILGLIFFIPLFLNFSAVNQSKNFLYEEMGKQSFGQLPKNSLFLTFGDKGTMIARYLQVGLGLRPDIIVANFHFIPDKWYQENLKQRFGDFPFPFEVFKPFKLSFKTAGEVVCQQVVPKIATFIEDRTLAFNPKDNKNCSYHPQGPVIKLDLPEKQVTKEELAAQEKNFWQPLQEKFKSKNYHDLRTKAVLAGYSQAKTFLAIQLSLLGDNEAALKAYIEAFEISSDNPVVAHLIAEKLAAKKDVEAAFEWEKKAIAAQYTFAEPYKNLGVWSLEIKQDKKQALSYFKKYLKYAEGSAEKEQIKKLVQQLEAT